MLLFGSFVVIHAVALGLTVVRLRNARTRRERIERGVDFLLFVTSLSIVGGLLYRLRPW